MEKEIRKKSLLLSIVSFMQFAGIVKERADNCTIDNIEGSRVFFNELANRCSYLHKLWSDNFGRQDIFKFSDDLMTYYNLAYEIVIGMNENIDSKSKNINTYLTHLISKVTLKKSATAKVLPLKKFDYESIFPADNEINNGLNYYKKTYNDLLNGVAKIIKYAENDNNLLAVSAALDSLFFEYLSNVPAFLNDDCIMDISLYEYAKMMASFISICYKQDKSNKLHEQNNFLVIRGDFFSIQNFIFNKEASSKNPAKLLRGKSFYVSLMSDIASLYILEELGLSYFNIMMNAAGQFVIISNNSNDICKEIEKIKSNVDEWLYEKYYCSVSLGFSIIECSKKDFSVNEFNKLILKMLYKKDVAKLTRFDLPAKDEFIYKDYYKKFSKSTSMCEYCGVEPANKDNPCDKCSDYIILGEKLTKAKYINIYHSEKGIFGKYAYGFNSENVKDAAYRMCIDLVNEDNIEYKYNCCNVVHYRSYVVCNDDKAIRSFDEIVKYGDGAEILAVLKADVDNLGLVFSCGLSEKDEDFNVKKSDITFSKTNMLSRSIHNFFSYFLYHLMKKECLNVYTVFAGGDDLFIVGKYNDIIKLAKLINTEFRKFTGNNSEVTISAGIGLFKTNVPIWYMAEETEKMLEQAKHYRKEGDNDIYKGNINILYSSCKYDEFVSWHNEFSDLFKYIESKGEDISKNFYYKIMEFCDMEATYKKDNTDINNLMWRPRLYYTVTKLGLKNDAFNILNELVSKIDENPNLVKSLIALKLYDLRNKKIKGNEDGTSK